MFKVQEGFGPFEENPRECWGVKTTRMTFTNLKDAQDFAERRYDRKVKTLMKSQPDWWKSYWVRVIPFP